ncbi:hypothetical protein GJ744_003462 [Endocarpon pusillum]|uniref:Uncharacterized protein n=1 Tax=Endocarpon pusillum TaxID=364733 RepID=A0A8H7ARJ4_9EURO|nr:hypothetical protein GJ744_003462 [Endocarpon pusillum]
MLPGLPAHDSRTRLDRKLDRKLNMAVPVRIPLYPSGLCRTIVFPGLTLQQRHLNMGLESQYGPRCKGRWRVSTGARLNVLTRVVARDAARHGIHVTRSGMLLHSTAQGHIYLVVHRRSGDEAVKREKGLLAI